MAYRIVIKNLNTRQFSIGKGAPLAKGVYVMFTSGEAVGLKNKFTQKNIVDLTPYDSWSKFPDIAFKSLQELVTYLQDNIVVQGVSPVHEADKTQMEMILIRLDTIISLLQPQNPGQGQGQGQN